MPFHATVVQVLIASPGDTQAERTAILTEASRWNGRHARGRGFVLSPWLYELHSTPVLGDRPQTIINSQGVDKADAVVAVFSNRLGTDAGISLTGTEEEIRRAREKGVPVHVYFNEADIPRGANVEDLARLQDFKQRLQDKGLYATFRDTQDLARQVIDAIEYDLDAFEAVPATPPPSGVDLRIYHHAEKEQKGLDKRGKMQYRHTSRDLVIVNEGDAIAENLRIYLEDEAARELHFDPPLTDGSTEARDLPGRSRFVIQLIPLGRANVDLVAQWTESGETHSQPFTVSVS